MTRMAFLPFRFHDGFRANGKTLISKSASDLIYYSKWSPRNTEEALQVFSRGQHFTAQTRLPKVKHKGIYTKCKVIMPYMFP